MIDQIDHYVRLMRDITIPAMQVHKTVGVAKIPVLTKRLNVITEALPHGEEVKGIEAILSYKTFKQGGNRITIGLTNTTREKIVLKKETKVVRVFAANVVPLMLALKMISCAKIMEMVVPPSGAGECPVVPNASSRNSITTMFPGPPKLELTP